MKLFVTGGAGFIGSNFIKYILKKYPKYQIVNYDKLTYAGNLNNLKDVSSINYKFIKGDICFLKLVLQSMEGCDCVINFAAESHVDRSIKNASDFIQTNVVGTFTLLEASKKLNIKKFIQISTDEVYGSILKGAFKETSPLQPNSPYSASKASADMLVRSYVNTYNFPAIITRCSNNYGPNQYPEKIIPFFIKQALTDKPLTLYGDGKNVRDWLYVIDHCRAIDIVLHKGKLGEIYNIGGGCKVSNIELTKIILRTLNKPQKLIKYVKDRPGHDRRYAINYNKIKKLGYEPKYSFKEAIADTIECYR